MTKKYPVRVPDLRKFYEFHSVIFNDGVVELSESRKEFLKMKKKLIVLLLIVTAVVSALRFQPTGKNDDWRLILVNGNNPVPYGYVPELMELSNGVKVDERIYPDLQRMFDDARNDGVYPVVGEGYRTHKEQKKMMSDKVESFIAEGYSGREAKKLAREWVAEAGKSEHETGLALDINADPSYSADGEVYEWLAENAYRYGFILRYHPDSEDITGISYEPWHYRYVGTDTAMEIHDKNITLEEYLHN